MRSLRPGNVFYGWWVVVAATGIMTVHSGVYFFGFGAFFSPLVSEFGWGRAALSGAFSLSRFEGGFFSPLAGVVVDRYGARVLLITSFLMMGLGFVLLSHVDSLSGFYLVYFLCFGIGGGFGIGNVVSSSVNNWFSRRRSLALGIAHSGVGLGGLGASFLAWLIEQVGWRQAAAVAGVTVMVLGVPLASLIRHKPEAYGLLRDGDVPSDRPGEPHAPHAGRKAGALSDEPTGSARQALRSSAFWSLTTCFNLRQFVTSAMAAHLIPYLVDAGYSLTTASSLLAFMALSSGVGRLGAGFIGDRVDKRFAMAGCLCLLAIGVLGTLASQSFWVVGAAMFVYGVAYGGTTPLAPSLIGDYFGRQAFATIMGFAFTVQLLGTIGGPLVAGYVFDVTGSYIWAFVIFAASCAAAIAIVLSLRPKAYSHDVAVPA